MGLEPGCPRCSADVARDDESWRCEVHGAMTPWGRAQDPEDESLGEYRALSQPLHTWWPWP